MTGIVTAAAVLLTLAAPACHGRPVWDGRHPAVWRSQVAPMCEARWQGRHGIIQLPGGPRFTAVCSADGNLWAWDVTGRAS